MRLKKGGKRFEVAAYVRICPDSAAHIIELIHML